MYPIDLEETLRDRVACGGHGQESRWQQAGRAADDVSDWAVLCCIFDWAIET
jgi:hypothetical protein